VGSYAQQRQIKQAESLREPFLFDCPSCEHCHARDIKAQQRCVLGKQLLFAFLFFCGSFSIFFNGKVGLSSAG
jgi:hypothetical protein